MQMEEVGVGGVQHRARTKDPSRGRKRVPLLYDYFTVDRRWCRCKIAGGKNRSNQVEAESKKTV